MVGRRRQFLIKRSLHLNGARNPSAQLAVAGAALVAIAEDTILTFSKELKLLGESHVGEKLESLAADDASVIVTTRNSAYISSTSPTSWVKSSVIPWGDPIGRPALLKGVPWLAIHDNRRGVSLAAIDPATGCPTQIISLADHWAGGSVDLTSSDECLVVASPMDALLGIYRAGATSVDSLAQVGYAIGVWNSDIVVNVDDALAVVEVASGEIRRSWTVPDTPIVALPVGSGLLVVGNNYVQYATEDGECDDVAFEGRQGRTIWHAMTFGHETLFVFEDHEVAACSLDELS